VADVNALESGDDGVTDHRSNEFGANALSQMSTRWNRGNGGAMDRRGKRVLHERSIAVQACGSRPRWRDGLPRQKIWRGCSFV